MMIGKVNVKSYKAKSSRLVRRKCPACHKNAKAELVDYGKGGMLLFCACSHVREVRR